MGTATPDPEWELIEELVDHLLDPTPEDPRGRKAWLAAAGQIRPPLRTYLLEVGVLPDPAITDPEHIRRPPTALQRNQAFDKLTICLDEVDLLSTRGDYEYRLNSLRRTASRLAGFDSAETSPLESAPLGLE